MLQAVTSTRWRNTRRPRFRLTSEVDGKVTLTRPEVTDQIAVFQWAARMEGRWPALALLHHSPNGGKRDAREAAKLKRMGVKPGVPDLMLPVAREGYIGLAIEMKVWPKQPTDLQAAWLRELQREGWRCRVCYSATAAIDILQAYVSAEPTRIAA